MGTLVDSSVLIAAERGEIDLDALIAKEGEEEIAIAAITVSELLHGVHRLPSAAGRARAEVLVERLITRLPVIPFDLAVARVHARLSAELRAKGTAVGAHELVIGATAVYLGSSIATRDLRSFRRIRGLDVKRW